MTPSLVKIVNTTLLTVIHIVAFCTWFIPNRDYSNVAENYYKGTKK